jgi:hypothetical protein
MTKVTPVRSGNQIELPAEWAAELGLGQYATLEKTDEGILVQACAGSGWDEVFADKLEMRSASPASDALEMTGDSVLF